MTLKTQEHPHHPRLAASRSSQRPPCQPSAGSPVRLVLHLAVLLSLAETPASVPVRQGRGGWTLNSVGYLLGPVLHLPQRADRGGKEKTALEVLDLWKALDLGEFSKKAPREGDAQQS